MEHLLNHKSMLCSKHQGSLRLDEIFANPSNCYYYSYKKLVTTAIQFSHKIK